VITASAKPKKKNIRILLLEDSLKDAELIRHALSQGGLTFTLEHVENREGYIEQLERSPPDIILSDYTVPSMDGDAALTWARTHCPEIPFIFVTGTMGEEAAVEVLRQGAIDSVLKHRLSRLVPSVERALREAEERSERRRAEERLRESHEQLRGLSVYLQYVREEERIRISREIHDELGQALTGLGLHLTWLTGRLPRTMRAVHRRIKAMSEHIDATIQTVRRIATELRPGILDAAGLVAALEWQANEFEKKTGIRCQVKTTVPETIWDQDLNTAFFRIFQETLTNVIRHANATRVDVRLAEAGSRLLLEVKDNGRGISEEQIGNTKSIGLLGMRERAALLGGEIKVQGQPGKGTTITVLIPRPEPNGHFAP
jgi:signal transduction histidine kinase